MKKGIITLIVGFVIFGGVSTGSSGETGKGFYVGLGAGTFPLWIYNSYYGSFELGYRFSKRIGISAETGYGSISTTYESEDKEGYYQYSYSSETTYSVTPINVSFLVTAPVGDDFTAYLGLGLGSYKIKIKEDWTEESSYYSDSDTDEVECNGYAPHISIGMEFSIFKTTSLFGEIKYIIGKMEYEESENGYHHMEKIPFFEGAAARIGMRIYF